MRDGHSRVLLEEHQSDGLADQGATAEHQGALALRIAADALEHAHAAARSAGSEPLAAVDEDVAAEFGPWLAKTGLASRKPVIRAAVVRSLGLLGTKEASKKIATFLEKSRDERRLRM